MLPSCRRWLVSFTLVLATACGDGDDPKPAPSRDVTIDVSAYFPAGTVLRDAYADTTTTVSASGTVTVTPAASGVVLLEEDGAAPTPFTWKNSVVYYAITDRFFNGDPTNDESYGRHGDGGDEVGTWHGGDWKGLTAKLDYLESLGVTALWISPIVEQVHGWVVGGSGNGFKHYAYHGYYALDFTRLDANYGTLEDLQTLVQEAHARGIRVLADVVLNHPGYATAWDLIDYVPNVMRSGPGGTPDAGAAFLAWEAGTGQNLNDWHGFVNYGSSEFANWWGVDWVRAGLGGGYQVPPDGANDELRQLASLPDFKTESATVAGLPPFLAPAGTVPGYTTPKADTGVSELVDGTVRDYLVRWHSDWVRQTGLDGFRCDTVKNVEVGSWRALKDAASAALVEWKAAHPTDPIGDAPFWMTGEVFGHGVGKDAYYTEGGFDSIINFSFQNQLSTLLANEVDLVEASGDLDAYYGGYSNQISGDPTYDILSYVSSHDTRLMFTQVNGNVRKQRDAGTALLLAPGGVQVFYGDESGRAAGPGGGDSTQGTRSDMNWSTTDAGLLAHWTKLASFRKRHAAIGAGDHVSLASPAGTWAFARTLDAGGVSDSVVVVIARPE